MVFAVLQYRPKDNAFFSKHQTGFYSVYLCQCNMRQNMHSEAKLNNKHQLAFVLAIIKLGKVTHLNGEITVGIQTVIYIHLLTFANFPYSGSP